MLIEIVKAGIFLKRLGGVSKNNIRQECYLGRLQKLNFLRGKMFFKPMLHKLLLTKQLIVNKIKNRHLGLANLEKTQLVD